MDAVIEFGLEATRWLQTSFPQLASFFSFFTDAGSETFYLALFPLLYWCVHKQFGRHVSYVFIFSVAVNAIAKHAFRGPRPFWIDAELGLRDEVGYGVPSNHMQSATVIYLLAAYWLRRYRWIWSVTLLLVLTMGVSRVYLGLHFVHDVAVGFLLGILILSGYLLWMHYFVKGFRRRILGYRLMIGALVPVGLMAIYLGALLIVGEPNTAVSWADRLEIAELESIEGAVTGFSALLGLSIGLVLEKSRVRFRVEGPAWKRAARYLLGMVIAVAIWAGLRDLVPAEDLFAAIPLRILRYGLLMLWVAYYAPALFIRLKLAEADPEPTIDLTLP